jgi:hypothetical protein
MKNFTFLVFCILIIYCENLQAQVIKITAGTDMNVLSGTLLIIDSLELTPTSTFTLSNTSITKTAVANHTPLGNYIKRVYHFANPTNAFTGSVQMYYSDGAELNGIAESALTLNVFDGSNWAAYTAGARNSTSNFVITNNVNAASLSELTMAADFAALPLKWKSFEAARRNKTVLLKWVTEQELNVKEFVLQHSTDGLRWKDIYTVAANGNSNSPQAYQYIHANPVTGANYYRVLQNDWNNSTGYSDTKSISFSVNIEPFSVISNPVINGTISLSVNINCIITIFNTEGKILWTEELTPGLKNIDASRFGKAAYYIKAFNTIQKISIL